MERERLGIWLAQSDRSERKFYEVSVHSDGTTSCTCASWRYRAGPKGQTCKHIDRYRAQIKNVLQRHQRTLEPPVIGLYGAVDIDRETLDLLKAEIAQLAIRLVLDGKISELEKLAVRVLREGGCI